MRRSFRLALCYVASVATLISLTGHAFPQQPQQDARLSQQAWTLDEALAQLRLDPRDAYLQYVVLQLARQTIRFDAVAAEVETLINRAGRTDARSERTDNVDLFSIFTGALAVQESLQLDTMRVAAGRGRRSVQQAATATVTQDTTLITNANASPTNTNASSNAGRGRARRRRRSGGNTTTTARPTRLPTIPTVNPPQIDRVRIAQERQLAALQEQRRREIVQVSTLTGPTIKSHPWEQMLAGRKPEVSALSRLVPEDFYLVEFRSLGKLLQAMDASDLWGTHLFNQAYREARTSNAGERLRRQLVLETEPILRPFYDLVVEEVAVTGSDPFVREGSDATILFRVKQADVFKARMEGFLANALKARSDAVRSTGKFMDVDYVHLETPDRELNVYAADISADLHVRSNSRAAFERVIAAIKGRDANGQTVRRLGETSEFAYIRTLMPRGAREEDGLVYLSDAFIRRLVGPELKLTERRRMLCYNHLRMIGHAALLYRTQHGHPPASLEELAESNTSPGLFGQGELSCPDGGRYSLSADGMTGVCSRHGHALNLTPNIEIPVREVTGLEADEYKAFVEEYNRYWRVYFDPIALRIKLTPQQYRLETIVLPLIDNSIYTSLAGILGGQPEALDALPVPKRNIFSLALRLNKEKYLPSAAEMEREFKTDSFWREMGIAQEASRLNFAEFVSKGLGNQVAFNVYDGSPTFDLNMSRFFGMLDGSTTGANRSLSSEELFIGFAIASLNSPVYFSFPVRDAKVVDDFLNQMDGVLALTARQHQRQGWFDFEQDFFRFPLDQAETYRGYGLRFGPLKIRLFWARIGGGFYIASKPFILEDLAAQHAERIRAGASGLVPDSGSEGHAMARVRAGNWNEVLPDYRLSWAENDREACLNNLGALSSVSRALAARATADGGVTSGPTPTAQELNQQLQILADRLHAVHFFCPEGGEYIASADGKTVSCSIHGTVRAPRQPAAPTAASAPGKLMSELERATATLQFTLDGLRAVVVIDRK